MIDNFGDGTYFSVTVTSTEFSNEKENKMSKLEKIKELELKLQELRKEVEEENKYIDVPDNIKLDISPNTGGTRICYKGYILGLATQNTSKIDLNVVEHPSNNFVSQKFKIEKEPTKVEDLKHGCVYLCENKFREPENYYLCVNGNLSHLTYDKDTQLMDIISERYCKENTWYKVVPK